MNHRNANGSLKKEPFEIPRPEGDDAELANVRVYAPRCECGIQSDTIVEFGISNARTLRTFWSLSLSSITIWHRSQHRKLFQKAITRIFDGLPGVRVYTVDVLL